MRLVCMLYELFKTKPLIINVTGISFTVTGQQYESAIQNMVEMGFEREQVIKAMRASFNNPDRAVEYLFSVRTDCRLTAYRRSAES